MDISGRRFTVIGAGRSGISAANLLSRRGGIVRLVDDNIERARPDNLKAEVTYEAGTHTVTRGDVVVLSPGIPEVSPIRGEVARVASEVIGEMELFARLCPCPIIAITGTDGKSTTTTMIGAIMAASGRDTRVGGNLGNPLCDDVDTLRPESIAVAEVSAFQLTTTDSFRPAVAVMTNIAEDHLDYHGGFEPYQAAKRRVWLKMESGDTVIINGDDPRIAEWPLPEGPTIERFTLSDPKRGDAYLEGEALWLGEERLMNREALKLLGDHNVANALSAALACRAMGVERPVIAEALAQYAPLAHRLQPVTRHQGVLWVNDSKATNPNAAMAGIKAITEPLIVLTGGSSKDADFGPLGALLAERAEAVICFGATREAIAEAVGDQERVEVVNTLAEAVSSAALRAREGDTVLLSPACASFDQFRSYAHRGDTFMALVAERTSQAP